MKQVSQSSKGSKHPKFLFAIIEGQIACGRVLGYMKYKDTYDIVFHAHGHNSETHREEHRLIRKLIPAKFLFSSKEIAEAELKRIKEEVAKARAEIEKFQQEKALQEAQSKIEEQVSNTPDDQEQPSENSQNSQ